MKTPEELAEEYNKQLEQVPIMYYLPTEPCRKAFLAGYQAAVPQWVSVQDRWPKDGEAVLITEGINVGICKAVVVQFEGHARLGWEKRFDTGDTSHWMPLPKLPEDK